MLSLTKCYQTFDWSAGSEMPGQTGPGQDRAQDKHGGVVKTAVITDNFIQSSNKGIIYL